MYGMTDLLGNAKFYDMFSHLIWRDWKKWLMDKQRQNYIAYVNNHLNIIYH